MKSNKPNWNARMATLEQLMETTLNVYFSPVPSKETLRNWFEDSRIRKFKKNPTAKRGGGTVWYSVADVEKFIRDFTM